MTTEMPTSFPLSRLLESIKSCLEHHFRGYFWVTAETVDVSRNSRSRHCYLELVETDAHSRQPVARARATIWNYLYPAIDNKFRQATGVSLHSGIKVMVLVEVQMHKLYGLSLLIKDIDPTYTLGDLAKNRQEVLNELKRQGIIDLNRQLPLPSPILNVAVISGRNAAGYGDFVKHLSSNPYGVVFGTVLFPALMQGPKTPASIVAALHRILDTDFSFDVVVIIRGGGASSDLSAFDQYSLAEAVAQFPIPILSGIGHDRDRSVLDHVAHRDFKTPTAVAEFLLAEAYHELLSLQQTQQTIIEKLLQAQEKNKQLLQLQEEQLRRVVQERVSFLVQKNQEYRHRLRRSANFYVRLHTERRRRITQMPMRLTWALEQNQNKHLLFLSLQQAELSKTLRAYFLAQSQRVEHMAQMVEVLHPKRILERGYSIVTIKNKALRSTKQLSVGDTVDIVTAQGSAQAAVTEIRTNKQIDID